MKKILILSSLLLTIFFTNAQVPENINYQTLIRDSHGNFISNEDVSIRLTLLQGSPSGAEIYTEEHLTKTNDYGLINLKIGEGASADVFSEINWAQETLFIKVEAKVGSSGNYEEIGISPFSSVPYALFAKDANTNLEPGDGIEINNKTISANVNSPLWNASTIQNKTVSANEPKSGDVLVYDGTQWIPGKQNMAPEGSGIISFNSDAPEGYEYSGNTLKSQKIDGNWEEVANLNRERRYGASCSLNDYVYIIGGETNSETATNSAERYNTLTNTWENITNLSKGIRLAAATSCNNKLYLAGGIPSGQSQSTNSVYTFDPVTSKWESSTPMLEARRSHALVEFDNKIYAIGGLQGSNIISSIEMYDYQSSTWSKITDIPYDVIGAKSIVFNGKIYIIGGFTMQGAKYLFKPDVYTFDLMTQQWNKDSELKIARRDFTAMANNEYIIVASGLNNDGFLNETEIYSMTAKQWVTFSNLNNTRTCVNGAYCNDHFYLIGGQYHNNKISSVEKIKVHLKEESLFIHQVK
jgi:N-acetylneuraminic acid mutarotase